MARLCGRCSRMRIIIPVGIIFACLGFYYVHNNRAANNPEVHGDIRNHDNIKRIEKQKSKDDLMDLLDLKSKEVKVNAQQRDAQVKQDDVRRTLDKRTNQKIPSKQRAPSDRLKIADISPKQKKPQSNSRPKTGEKLPDAKPNLNSKLKSYSKKAPQANSRAGGGKQEQYTALNTAQRRANFYESNNKKDPELACTMPELKPFDDSIRHLLEVPDKLQCNGSMLTTLIGDRYYIDQTVSKGTKYSACFVSKLERYDDDITRITDPKKVNLVKQGTQLNYKVKSDFTIFGCQKGPRQNEVDMIRESDPTMHVDLHAHIVERPDVIEDRLHRKQQKRGMEGLGVNVIMLGIDSTSRMNFLRQMPKSYKALYKLGAVTLTGYNIVGDATTGALIPMLTGRHESELPDVRRDAPKGAYLDSYNFIWNMYSANGYVTMFAEDQPKISAFNLRLNGFDHQPTDHYMRTFWQEANVRGLCLGPKPVHKIMLDYTTEFMTSYPTFPKFGLTFFTGLTHSNINKIQLMDDDLANFLETSQKNGLLNNTVFILFSDHGSRYTKIRTTMQGKLEERLPYMSIILPKWLKNTKPKMHANLMKNHDRLTTPFDIFETLQSVIHHSTTLKKTSRQRGISLFNEVPKQRTCNDADVDLHWCACLQWKPVKFTNMTGLAKSLIGSINALTKPHRQQCVDLSLLRIVKIDRLEPTDELMKFLGTKDKDQREPDFHHEHTVDVHSIPLYFQITVEAMPGRALFEATLKVHPGLSDTFITSELASPISRINPYGFTSSCVEKINPSLAKYCFCKQYSGMPVAFMGASEKEDKVISHSV
ncbi:uncharacterized protein [Amphiura filiformis]|uniref:uncharacterized protein n=1 Tax=Amphiura filiformis TaxID=82378 RepID=UPI003B213DCD